MIIDAEKIIPDVDKYIKIIEEEEIILEKCSKNC